MSSTLRICAALLVLLAGDLAGAAERQRNFVVENNPYVIGQAPDWLDRDTVVWHEAVARDEAGDGDVHIYRSQLDGSDKVCLTCGLEGPNQVPVAQPDGDWILFHSWNGHSLRLGGAGFGGIGSDVWVMTRDGQQRTNLTKSSEVRDNFHAYWSPDGKWIVWTSLNWNSAEGGDGRSDIRVARFDPSGPRLVDERVVRPGNGHWYETQWWAPDGSGFLYTETYDVAINPELFFCRLKSPARGDCQPVRLTNDLAWDEQAIFTKDMKKVLFMSSRNQPGAHNNWITLANLLGLPADFDHILVLNVFGESFLQPVFQTPTDLYELELQWNRGRTRFKPGAVRRLTTTGDQGWVIPEFAFDPSGKRLLWTQNKYPADVRVDMPCILRQIRADFVNRLSGVRDLSQIPFAIHRDMRAFALELLQDPADFPYQGRGCGGDAPPTARVFDQETKIGRYE